MPHYRVTAQIEYVFTLDLDEFEREDIDELRDKDGVIEPEALCNFVKERIEELQVHPSDEIDSLSEVLEVAVQPIPSTSSVS